MARYAIYDGVSNVITPVGEVLTSEEWYTRYPWGKIAKMVVGGGVINGSLCMVYDEMVEMYDKMGCDFSDCTTDQDYLDAIEAYEDNPPEVTTISDQDRIANALEDLVVLTELGQMEG